MANKLVKECPWYEQIHNLNDYSLENFRKCVLIVQKVDKIEAKYILFNLKSLYEDSDTGSERVDKLSKFIKLFAGDSFKASFVIAVIETALE